MIIKNYFKFHIVCGNEFSIKYLKIIFEFHIVCGNEFSIKYLKIIVN